MSAEQLQIGSEGSRPACCQRLLTTRGIASPAVCSCGRRWRVSNSQWELVEDVRPSLEQRLASELAWKLLHPQQLAESSIYALMDYRELVGDGCPQIVVDAIEQIRGRE